ncbi:MAG TPA: VOC family protein [Caulobacteraceae bacterium]|nr:VOC family protein [Caulobacteraceae bacterium]
MVGSVTPFLMFQGEAEAAMNFYAEVLGAEILALDRHGPGSGAEGKVLKGLIRVAGQTVRCFDSPVKHAFTFTPASSLFVECESEDEIRRLAHALGQGGGELMPLAAYGFSHLFAWVNDRFGVSWQLNWG